MKRMDAEQIRIQQEFIAKGREFIKRFPDFNESLNDAAARNLDFPAAAVDEVARMGRPDVVYYLSRPENHPEAHALMGLADDRLRDKLHRLAARLDAQKTFEEITPRRNDTDAYLQKRREDIRLGKRRR